MEITTNKRSTILKFVWIIFAFLFIVSCNQESVEPSSDTSKFTEALQQKPNSQQLDSLYVKVLMLPNNSVKVDLLLQIYKKTIRERPIRYDILDTTLYISKKLKYDKGIAIAYNRKGINNRYKLEYLESVKYHKQSLQYWNKTTDTLGRIKCLNSMGVSLRRLNNEKEAMNYYVEALKLSKAINHDKSIAVALNGIGNVFVNIKQFNSALPYFKEALAIEIKLNNKKGISYDLSNIGEVFVFEQQYDSALKYYNNALKLAEERNYKDRPSIIYNYIGYLFQQKADYNKSNEYYNLAIPNLEKYNGKRYLSNTLINLGVNYTYLGIFEPALTNIVRGLALAQEINSPENILLGYNALSKYYKKTESYKLALGYHKETVALRDSINSEESKQAIAALEAIYENELKDQEIKNYQYQVSLQKNQNILQLIIIVFLILLVSGLFVFFRLKRKNDLLVVNQMRNDIEEYIHRIENFENTQNQEDETNTFNKNIEQFGLTERETDVLLLISQGLRNEEIANKLFLSVSTIKNPYSEYFC